MKTLLILRHAKSSWSNARQADHDRPLNTRGRRDAPRMGRLLRAEDLVPDLVISSTAERAVTTAELVAESCGYEEEIVTTRGLYHGEPEDYVTAILEAGGDSATVLVVGHNPGVEALVEELSGEDEVMPTGALAHIVLPIATWQQLELDSRGTLENLWRPKELD